MKETKDAIYEDKLTQQKIRHIFSDMDLCGCGSEDKFGIVRRLLEHAEKRGSFYAPVDDDLSAKAVEFIAHVMSSDRWALLEHGTSINCSSLTDKGKILLKFLRDFGDDDSDGWPEWVNACEYGDEW